MGNLTITDTNVPSLMAMADGLLAAGNWTMAAQLYDVALKGAQPPDHGRILVRLGIANGPARRRVDFADLVHRIDKLGPEPFVGEGLATWGKTLPFMSDERFLHLAAKHAQLLPIANWHWNLQTALWAAKQALNVDGDFVELGVFKGHTTLFLAEYLDFPSLPRHWRLYDTFEGIPDDQVDAGWEETNKRVYGDTFSYEEVKARFAPFPNIEVIKGRVPEIFAENCAEKIAFLHIDLNNSTAEIQALDALFDRVSPGGVILFDDYGWVVARTQHDAENRWFAERGLQILPLPTGQGVFIKTA